MPHLQSVSRNSLKSFTSLLRSQLSKKRTQSSVLSPHRFFVLLTALLFALCALPLPAANAAQVTLAWDPSSGSASGYNLHYGTSSKNYDYSVNVGNNTSCTISGLQEGTTYYYAATAYNTSNEESDYSDEIAYRIPTPVKGGSKLSDFWKLVKYK